MNKNNLILVKEMIWYKKTTEKKEKKKNDACRHIYRNFNILTSKIQRYYRKPTSKLVMNCYLPTNEHAVVFKWYV
jgi:hypothetical protein